jgi:hypothetical protein
MSTLENYRKNIYSQNGEDGVIEEICRRLNILSGSFVEFGAWDGIYLSNTYNLLKNGWNGVYIEGDIDKYHQLVSNLVSFQDAIVTINAYVEPVGENSLDNLLKKTFLKTDFDLLSIDIDSLDWHIWRSLINYQPKIVVIEINSAIPVGIYQTHRDERIHGSSFTSMVDLAVKKGYMLVCHTGNLIFVRNDFVVKLDLPAEELMFPELLFNYGWKRLTYDYSISPQQRKLLEILSTIKRFFQGRWKA